MSNARNLANLLGTGTQITTADIAGGAFQANKNLIINGAMQVAQRGTSVTGYTDGSGQTYVADRWKIQEYGTPAAQYTITQNDIASENIPFSKSLKFACTATETSSSYLFRTRYDIEGQDCQILQYGTSDAKDVTLSFWVKSNLTGVISGFVYNYTTNTIIGWEASITSADTWERKTVTIPPDSNTVFDDNTTGLSMAFTFSADSSWGSSWSTTSWQTYISSNHNSPSNINLGSSTSNYLELTGIQLEVGDTATPFEHRSYADELARCQRYYTEVTPQMVHAYSTTNVSGKLSYPVTMRATPTGTFKSGTAFVDPIAGASIFPSSINTTVYEYGLNDSLMISRNYSGLTANKPYWVVTTSMIFGMDAEL